MNGLVLECAAIFFAVWMFCEAVAESVAGNEACEGGYVMVRAKNWHPFVQLIDDQGHGVRCEAEGQP